ncbi:hypothetical protein LSTR_LSTR015781 [Laodelphax striatellus]|uniref:Uncharacterized protein n=1 Tax=Laodelphax striatellus TaxID=195883 RepID=A0A482X1G5_LAOST|nr:hypothetical protein LSTR_LSTR015781 [Laodelphax striatellus]
MMEPSEEVPPPVPKAPPPAADHEERRKSLGLLREISTTWTAEPNPTPAKYSLNEEEGACGGGGIDVVVLEKEREKEKERENEKEREEETEKGKEKEKSMNDAKPALKPPHNPPPRMSTMEEEVIRDRLRLTLLRECAEILDAEPRYTRDTFRRGFLNKVSKPLAFLDHAIKYLHRQSMNSCKMIHELSRRILVIVMMSSHAHNHATLLCYDYRNEV